MPVTNVYQRRLDPAAGSRGVAGKAAGKLWTTRVKPATGGDVGRIGNLPREQPPVLSDGANLGGGRDE
jgi:hypothetical protein